MGLHESFGVCAVVVVIGHAVRRIFLTPDTANQQISLVSKILLNVTLPAVLLRAFMHCRTIRPEALALSCYGIVINALLMASACALFLYCRAVLVPPGPEHDPREFRSSAIASTFGLNIGLFFYPIMESIAGDSGVELIAWVDLMNGIFIFVFIPMLFALSSRPPVKRAVDDAKTRETDSAEHVELSEIEAHADPECPPAHDKKAEKTSLVVSSVEKAPSVDRKVIMKKMGVKFMANMPLWSMFLGLVLGLTGAGPKLPSFIVAILNVLSKVNSGMSYLLVGLILDLRVSVLRSMWRPVLASMAVRYAIGVGIGVLLYFTLGSLSLFSHLGRLVLLIAGVMPTTVVTGVYASEWGWDPTLAGILINTTIVVSFVLLWGMISLAGLTEASEASFLSESSLLNF
eukprot:m51a1_g5929 hypothetical protein (402) ;mRNA; f:81957-83436